MGLVLAIISQLTVQAFMNIWTSSSGLALLKMFLHLFADFALGEPTAVAVMASEEM
jgi:hypothetical protein